MPYPIAAVHSAVRAGIMGGGGNNLGPVVDYLFDSGSLSSYTLVDDTPTIRLIPRKHWNNTWAWFAVRSNHWEVKTPHFVVSKANHFNLVAGEWLACWATSPDTEAWTLFDNMNIGATDLEFYNDTAFPAGTIYVASLPMYPFARTRRKVEEWAANALAWETASTTGNIVSTATARDNRDGRTTPALPYYGIKITTPQANSKNKGILTSGNHPSETPGSFMLEGAVDWLLGGSAKAKFLLDWFEIYVYPSLNPQGRWGGWFRSSPETPESDNNRLWDGTGVNEAVDAFKSAFSVDTEDVLEVALDFHSWMASDGNKGLTGDSAAALWVDFIAAMQALDATFTMRADDTTASMLGNYWANLATPAKLPGHIDHGGVTTLGPADWETVGQNTMVSLANMLAEGRFSHSPGVGARDFNGTTDRIDWASFATLTSSAVSISAWIYLDGFVGNADYILCLHRSGDAAIGLVLSVASDTAINFYRSGTTALNVVNSTAPIAGGWHHVLATHDGVITTATSVKIYLDGVESTYTIRTNGDGEYAPTGTVSIGGRKFDDNRNFDGKLAQVRMFNRVLGQDEIDLEVAGQVTTTAGLVYVF